MRGSAPPGIARFVSTAILGIVLLLNGNSFKVRKDIHTPALNTGIITQWDAQSGSTIFPKGNIDVFGNHTVSGSYTTQNTKNCSALATSATGSIICGSPSLSLSSGDARYVNTSGDTMTGALTINLTSGTRAIDVKQTISGSTVYTYNLVSPLQGSYTAFTSTTDVTIGTGASFDIPPAYSGSRLNTLRLSVKTAGTTNATTVVVRRLRPNAAATSYTTSTMTTTGVSVDSGELNSATAATPYVIATGESALVQGGDKIHFVVTTVSSTAPKGLDIGFKFSPP